MAEIVTSQNAVEDRNFHFVAEASALGIAPGMLPDQLRTDLGNGLAFTLIRVREDSTMHYAQILGCLTLTVLND